MPNFIGTLIDYSLALAQHIYMQQDTETNSTKWIENLALEELNMDESGVIHFNDHLNPSFALEESSINFMNELRDKIDFYATRFNEYRGNQDSGNSIKIFKISNTINDFMLFRNALRLIISRKSDDLISINFIRGGVDLYSGKMRSQELDGVGHEIRANIGAFNQISWKYEGDDINIDALVKHYLCEFIRNSAK
ncbi:hypothetical protein N9O57_02125 [bacterium]|nr:hypothetical protein [bacterium]